jgi:IS5 family transposase
MEEALHDMPVFREFAKLDDGAARLLDETISLRFRRLLKKHKLTTDMLRVVNAILQAKGLVIKKGTPGLVRHPPACVAVSRRDGLSAPLRMDRLAALEHRNEGLDLAPPAGIGLHVVHPECQCESVLRAQRRQHRARLGVGADGGLQVVGHRERVAHGVGACPATIGLVSFHIRLHYVRPHRQAIQRAPALNTPVALPP